MSVAQAHVINHHLVAGISAGALTSFLLNPLDLIKVRFQVADGTARSAVPNYTGVVSAFREVVKGEGFRGLYKGVAPAMSGSAISWGLYFYFYERIKGWHVNEGHAGKDGRLGTFTHMSSAMTAGACCVFLTNPLWLVKTRLQLQVEKATAPATAGSGKAPYGGMLGALRAIVREEGFRGLYRGLGPALLLTSHGAVQFGVYEEMKRLLEPADARGSLSSVTYFAMGAVSKVAASTATYPFQVVKARLQRRDSPYKGMGDCAVATWRKEGARGFYRGLWANTLRVVPASALTLVLYEKVRLASSTLEQRLLNAENV